MAAFLAFGCLAHAGWWAVLVFAMSEQKLVLGRTGMGVNPPLQISACIAVAAVSVYMVAQWRRSRQGQGL